MASLYNQETAALLCYLDIKAIFPPLSSEKTLAVIRIINAKGAHSHIKFKKILTKEQFQKYEDLKAKNKGDLQSSKINQSYLTAQDEELDF